MKPGGWYRTFLKEARGAIQVGKSEIPVRAKPVKSGRLRDAVDRAYLERYNTKGALKYAKDLCRPKSRATTMELVPLSEPNPSLRMSAFGRPQPPSDNRSIPHF
jgi:hypothetical protein